MPEVRVAFCIKTKEYFPRRAKVVNEPIPSSRPFRAVDSGVAIRGSIPRSLRELAVEIAIVDLRVDSRLNVIEPYPCFPHPLEHLAARSGLAEVRTPPLDRGSRGIALIAIYEVL